MISGEQFNFIHHRKIHNVLYITQEALHSVKQSHEATTILKLDLSKTYDRVNWTFLHLVLGKMGMDLSIINWIMGCIQLVSLIILINRASSRFFRATRGLRQGCPLFPFLFLITVESLSKLLNDVMMKGTLRGIKVVGHESISHLLFVNHMLFFSHGYQRYLSSLK
jgi:hypothetical protein